jgi:hypothetical protein
MCARFNHGVFMSLFYEIVELENGDVVLRRADDESSEPLVQLHFSTESLNYLGESKFAVAKAMIEAGMDAASDPQDGSESAEEYSDSIKTSYLLH